MSYLIISFNVSQFDVSCANEDTSRLFLLFDSDFSSPFIQFNKVPEWFPISRANLNKLWSHLRSWICLRISFFISFFLFLNLKYSLLMISSITSRSANYVLFVFPFSVLIISQLSHLVPSDDSIKHLRHHQRTFIDCNFYFDILANIYECR